jgi:D-beta-D-heptose 7-phosphate kinase/D-beta-D-heptose 1-phosphate adenosyltransferase
MVTIEEVMDYIRSSVDMDDTKIIGRERIADLAVAWRRNGERIIFTNGCFDLLHIGHVNYLKKAAALGTKLIVGVNSDESVRRLKGKERPVNPETARMGVLAALGCVDAVVLFTEDTPLELIRDVTPDVLVKGGDYRIEEIVGREYAKETVTIPLTEGVSTTGILARMKGAE